MAVRDVPSAREAITTFRVLERFEAGPKDDGYSLIECKLFTGRTHQIRVHMQYTRPSNRGRSGVQRPRPPRRPGPAGRAASSYTPTASPSSTRRPASPWPSPTICRATCRKRSDSLAARSLGKTEAGREVAELMATSPVPSVEGEVPDE